MGSKLILLLGNFYALVLLALSYLKFYNLHNHLVYELVLVCTPIPLNNLVALGVLQILLLHILFFHIMSLLLFSLHVFHLPFSIDLFSSFPPLNAFHRHRKPTSCTQFLPLNPHKLLKIPKQCLNQLHSLLLFSLHGL
jgi:hypothetical protein